MFVCQCQEWIFEVLWVLGGVCVLDFIEEFQVFYMMICCDFDVLVECGLVEKVYGGVMVVMYWMVDEFGFEVKLFCECLEKEVIVVEVVWFVWLGMVIGVMVGMMMWMLVCYFWDILNFMVVINLVLVVEVMCYFGCIDFLIVFIGGLCMLLDVFVGLVVDQVVCLMYVDLLFMGVYGMEECGGFIILNLFEVEINCVFVCFVCQFVVVVDYMKWGIVGLLMIVVFDEVDVFVIDDWFLVEFQVMFGEYVECYE